MPKKQTEWSRAYNEAAYDRLAITVPKGRKSVVEACAQAEGTTVNGLVNALLREKCGYSEQDWKGKPASTPEE